MRRILPLTVAAALLLSGCKKSIPDNVAAMVNNRPITYADLDKQFQLQFSGSGERTNDDQAVTQKLEILRTMIDNEVMLQRAEKQSLMAVDTDVDAKFNELKSPYTQEEFQKLLTARKISADDLKVQLRRELSVGKLIAKEITSHIAISDKDVAEFYNGNKAGFNLAEPQVHLAQILVTPQPNPEVKNLKSDKAQTEEQAKRKIQMIEARLRQGEDFADVAKNFSEDPSTAPNGGDLGFVPESSLEKANPLLRKMVVSMQAGQVSGVIPTPEGYRLLKLISKEPAGQRELNDPRVQQSIRETLINRKDQLLRAAYYEVARNEAQVVNQLAISITANRDKK